KTEIVALEIILIASAPLLPAQPDAQTIVTEPHFDIAIRRLNDAQHRAEMGKAIFELQKVTAK
uniref:hypothetical protein n=1 Tax=Janthinobacterium sp. TaxID=1871054 RepID=UPI00293D5DA1